MKVCVLAEQVLRVFLVILRKNSLSLPYTPYTQFVERCSMTYDKINSTIEAYSRYVLLSAQGMAATIRSRIFCGSIYYLKF